MPFRIGLVGCGHMTREGHGPACKKYASTHPDTCLIACCDTDLKAAQASCWAYGFEHAYTDYREMIAREKPDALLVVTPEHITARLVVEVLRMGVPVLLEKPPGVNAAENAAIAAAAHETKTTARVAFNRRHMPLFAELKRQMREVGGASAYIGCDVIRWNRGCEDFSLTAVHAIDAARHLAGVPYASVSFDYQQQPYQALEVTNFYLRATFQNGARAQLSFLPAGGANVERYTVVMTSGHTFFLSLPVLTGADANGSLVHADQRNRVHITQGDAALPYWEESGFYAEDEQFFDYVRSGAPYECDVESGLSAIEIAACIRRRAVHYSARLE